MSPSNQNAPAGLVSVLKGIPALIDVYLEMVEEVMRHNGFDREKCEFVCQLERAASAGRFQPARTMMAKQDDAFALAG